MPEQITKYPEVTMQVLESSGAQCAKGVEPRILTRCPAEQFCSLPGGEICVYGIDAIPQMTQLTATELGRVVCPELEAGGATASVVSSAEICVATGLFVLGLVGGRLWRGNR